MTRDALDRIEHAAATTGYLALVDHIRGLRALVEAAGGRKLYPDARKAALRRLGQIGEVLKELEGSGAPATLPRHRGDQAGAP